MNLLKRLSELSRALALALDRGLHDEGVRAIVRLVFVIVAVLACGAAGWLIVQRIPPRGRGKREVADMLVKAGAKE